MNHVKNTTGAAITVESGDTANVLRVEGDLDSFSAAQLRDGFASLVDRGDTLVDIRSVPFMDSAGLGALIGGIRRLREAGSTVAVCSTRSSVSRLLQMTGLDRIVTISDSYVEAMQVLAEERLPALLA